MIRPSRPPRGRSIAPRPYPLPQAELPLPSGPCALWLSAAVLAAISLSTHAILDLKEA